MAVAEVALAEAEISPQFSQSRFIIIIYEHFSRIIFRAKIQNIFVININI